MTLPTLTWSLGTPVAAASDSGADVLAAIGTAITASTFWSIDSSSASHLELTPASGPISDSTKGAKAGFRALLTSGSITGGGTGSNLLRPDSSDAVINFGIVPDGGTYGGTVDVAEPFGAGARWSKYWAAAGSDVESVYIIESDEALCIVMKDDSVGSSYAILFGAIIEAPDTSSAESDERLYGMMTSGAFLNTDIWGNSVLSWLYHDDVTNTGPHMCAFLPFRERRSHIDNSDSLSVVTRVQRFVDRAIFGVDDPFVTLAGTRVHLPVYLHVDGSEGWPMHHVGKLRQVYMAQYGADRKKVLDGDSAEQAIIYASPDPGPAVAFGNS